MGNEVTIRVTARDTSGAVLDAAAQKHRKLGDTIAGVGQRASRALKGNLADGLKTATRGLEEARVASEKAGASWAKVSGDVAELDTSIGKARQRVQELGLQFAKTNDQEVFAQLKDARRALSGLEQIRRSFSGVEQDARRAAGAVGRAARDIERAQQGAAREADKAARDVERSHRRAAAEAAKAHAKAAQQIRESHRRTASTGLDVGDALGKLMTGRLRAAADGVNGLIEGLFRSTAMKAAETSQSIVASFITAAASGTAMTAATGGVNLLVGALIAAAVAAATLVVGFLVLAPVVSLVAGAAGAAATALVGLAGAGAVMMMGLGGLGDAWSAYGQKAGGGGGNAAAAAKKAAQAQREVENATYDLEQAQRSYLQSQEAVNRAIQDEIERRDDLKRSVAGAAEDQVGAALAVQRAQERLNEALAARQQGEGSDLDVAEAEHGLRQAALTVGDLKDRLGDLKKEQADNAKVGVKGSEAVVSAMERQEQAARSLLQAEQRLTDAKAALKEGSVGAAGGVDRFAEAMAKLSPNARALVRTLIELKPKFDELKKSVQDKLLEGYAGQVKDLAKKWLPALKDMLGDLAGVFNRIGANIMKAFGRRQFIDDVGKAMDGFGEGVEIAFSHVDKLIEAIGRLARGSVPFFRTLGRLVDQVIVKFSDWINTADKSGKLETFMEKAANTLWDVGAITGKVIKITGKLIQAFFPSSKKVSDSFLGGVKRFLDRIDAKLSDPKFKAQIKAWVDNAGTNIKRFVADLQKTMTTVSRWVNRIDGWVRKIENMFNRLASVSRMAAKVAAATTAPGLGAAIGGAIGSFMGRAHGGVAGGLTMVGERGRELVDLPHGSRVHPNNTTESMLAGMGAGGGQLRLSIDSNVDTEFARLLLKVLRVQVRTHGRGSAQALLG